MQLEASNNRSINYLRLSLTDRCNQRCLYCMPKEGVRLLPASEIMTYEEILRLIRLMVPMGITKVRLTGGEPLVRRGVVGFVEKLKAVPGLEEVVMTTNAVLLDQYAEPLRDAGLDRLNISLDTRVPQRYRELTRGGDLAAFWRGIEAAQEAGFRQLKFNTVVMRGINHDELGSIAQLAHNQPWQMRFIEYMPMGQREVSWKQAYLPYRELVELLQEQLARQLETDKEQIVKGWQRLPSPPGSTAQVVKPAGFEGSLGFISPLGAHFCHSCNRLRLAADGRLYACLLESGEVDLRQLMRSGAPDGEVERAIRETATAKPLKHQVEVGRQLAQGRKKMSQVGG